MGGATCGRYDLDMGYDTGRDRVFLLTPVSVYHHITEDSPLHGLTQEDLASAKLELVVNPGGDRGGHGAHSSDPVVVHTRRDPL